MMNYDERIVFPPMLIINGYPLFNPVYYVLGVFKYIYIPGMSDYYLRSIIWFLLFGGIAFVIALIETLIINHIQRRQSTIHGTAAFGDTKMLKDNGYLNSNGVVCGQTQEAKVIAKRKTGIDSQTGLETTKTSLSLREKKPGKLICHSGDVHTLLLAPSGSGKGIGPVLGTILSWLKSIIVLDPKGENYEITSKYRSKFSRIVRFAPTDKHNTLRWNPVIEIRDGIEHAFSDCDMIADTIIPSAGGDNAYFTDSAKSIVTTALLHIRFSDYNNKSLSGMRDFLSSGNEEDLNNLLNSKDGGGASPTLGKSQAEAMLKTKHFFIITEEMWEKENYLVRNKATGKDETHNTFEDKGYKIGERYYDEKLESLIRKGAADILSTNAKEKASVWKTIAADIRLFDDEGVRFATSESDFEISDFFKTDKPISLYLVIPNSDIERLAPLTKILISLLLKKLSEGTTSYGSARLPYNVLVLLDEFPLLGKFPFVQSQMGICRGFGIFFFIVCQSLNQLVERYGENHAFLDHCTCQIIFAPGSVKDAELYSRAIGNETVREEKVSRSGNMKIGANNLNFSDNNMGRALLDAADIMRIPPDSELIKIHNLQPVIAKKLVFYDDPRFKHKASKTGLSITELYAEAAGLPNQIEKRKRIAANKLYENSIVSINNENHKSEDSELLINTDDINAYLYEEPLEDYSEEVPDTKKESTENNSIQENVIKLYEDESNEDETAEDENDVNNLAGKSAF